MNTRTSEPATAEQILVLLGAWDILPQRVGILIGLCRPTVRGTVDATSVASTWLRVASIAAPLFIRFTIGTYLLGFVFLALGVMAWIGALIIGLFNVETRDRVVEEISP